MRGLKTPGRCWLHVRLLGFEGKSGPSWSVSIICDVVYMLAGWLRVCSPETKASEQRLLSSQLSQSEVLGCGGVWFRTTATVFVHLASTSAGTKAWRGCGGFCRHPPISCQAAPCRTPTSVCIPGRLREGTWNPTPWLYLAFRTSAPQSLRAHGKV